MFALTGKKMIGASEARRIIRTKGNVNFQHDTFRFTLLVLVTHFLPSHKATSRFSLLYQQPARRPPNWFTSSPLFSLWSSAGQWRNPVHRNPRGSRGVVYTPSKGFWEELCAKGITSVQRREKNCFPRNFVGKIINFKTVSLSKRGREEYFVLVSFLRNKFVFAWVKIQLASRSLRISFSIYFRLSLGF